jgi:hypothetical protein
VGSIPITRSNSFPSAHAAARWPQPAPPIPHDPLDGFRCDIKTPQVARGFLYTRDRHQRDRVLDDGSRPLVGALAKRRTIPIACHEILLSAHEVIIRPFAWYPDL